MSRTRKKIPKSLFRKPKGRRNAIKNNARKGAIPPDSWDDKHIDDIAYIPYKIAKNMKRDGKSNDEIIKTLMKNYKIRKSEAKKIISISGW